MQLGLPFLRASPASACVVQLDGHPVPLFFVRTRRARHYILRVRPDGAVRVTVPWRGSRSEALRFVSEPSPLQHDGRGSTAHPCGCAARSSSFE